MNHLPFDVPPQVSELFEEYETAKGMKRRERMARQSALARAFVAMPGLSKEDLMAAVERTWWPEYFKVSDAKRFMRRTY